jgi:hypothetical protein
MLTANTTFLIRNIHAVTRDILSEVVVSTRLASYRNWRSSFLAVFYDGARLLQLVLITATNYEMHPKTNIWYLNVSTYRAKS